MQSVGAWAARAAGLVGVSSVLLPWKEAQCIPCTPLMMSLMACYKAHKYDKTKCEFEQERLMKCTMSQSLEMKKKDSSRYHLMRLLRRIRR